MEISDTTRLFEKSDLKKIAIVLCIALAIGVYLIATTVVISKDGVFYITQAQQFASNPIKIIKTHPPGYPFLIFAAHGFASLFTDGASNQTWIYSAQSVSLLCRLLALIPLYFIGKLLVGGKNSFWAIIILIILPNSAKYCAEVLRAWPYILFLSTGFFFSLWGAKSGRWWMFGFVGLSSGVGYLIRPESFQLILYGVGWLGLCILRPELWNVSRWKSLIALVLLLLAFAIPTVPYMKCTGRITPPIINRAIEVFSANTSQDAMDQPGVSILRQNQFTAEIVSGKALKALGEIFKTIGENLMWFFMPAIFIGLFCHLKKKAKTEDVFLISIFIFVNVIMMLLKYCCIHPHISQRWSMPLIAFTVFYIPVGLQIIGGWLNKKRARLEQKEERISWFTILLLIGIGICLPKLLRPIHTEKRGYREAANWLRQNTDKEDMIAVSDRRIAFYAERKGLGYDKKIPKQAKYIVNIRRKGDEWPEFGTEVEEKNSVWVNKRIKKKRIVIYEAI